MTELEAWNSALLETLLPATGSGRGVLLACDDEALAAAADRLGVPRQAATEVFVTDLCAAYGVTTARGLSAAVAQMDPYSRLPAPRLTPPPFLTALCVTVLAASRMNRDEHLSTSAYYQRLCDLLGIELLERWPAVAGFKELVQRGMRLLESWLADDEQGRRGVLLLPSDPRPSLVGYPISQTLLRGRDRALLGAFFVAHGQHVRGGYDPVLLLRRWSGRERLTHHAQEALQDSALHEQLAAAIHTAFSGWDGSFTDSVGQRLLPGLLRLNAAPGHVGMRLAVRALSNAATARTPTGTQVQLRAYPDAAGLPLDLLHLARDGAVRLNLDGRSEAVIAVPGPTVLFALGTGGLEQIAAASGEPVWVLTCDPALLDKVPEGSRRFRAPLPSGWALLVDMTPDELPESARVSSPDVARVQGATLEGGLPLGAGAWLVDYPPHVSCDLPEPALVTIDSEDFGYMEPGEPLKLDMLAGQHGAHTVEVADVYRLEFELRDRGLREGAGSLARFPQDPVLLRSGAITTDHAAGAVGAQVSGALITGGPDLPWSPPLMATFNATVHVIYKDGSVRAYAPPEPPVWLTQVGLGHAVTRWEIGDGRDAVWLCIASDPYPRVLARLPVDVPTTDEVLDLVDWFAGNPVIGDEDAGRRWQRLVALTEVDEEPLDAE